MVKGPIEDYSSFGENSAIVIDDGSLHGINEATYGLFLRGSHHNRQTVFLVQHNLYNNNKFSREISRNANIIVLFRNLRDQSILRTLCGQLSPQNSRELLKILSPEYNKAYGYLLFDLRQKCPEFCRYRANIFNEIPSCFTSSSFLSSYKVHGEVAKTPFYISYAHEGSEEET
jgi:hypothetical protein